MAISIMPQPVLDNQDGDEVVAQIIESFPDELSDRSPGNPAVVIASALGLVYEKNQFQLNALPQAYVQQLLATIGSPLVSPTAATATQTFTLGAPQPTDTVIPAGSQVSTVDGSLTATLLSDVVIPAYQSFYDGYLTVTAGSTTVRSSANDFVTGLTWVGQQIQVSTNGQGGTWYTIASVSSANTLTIAAPAAASAGGAGTSFNVGPVLSSAAQVQFTSTGSNTNVGSGTLTSANIANVSATTNTTAGVNGADQETAASGLARAQDTFARRDVVITASDYERAAERMLGVNGRARAIGNYADQAQLSGVVSLALLSPNWTTSSSVSAQERTNVIRDLYPRTFIGSTTLDLAANIEVFNSAGSQPVICVWRKAQYSEAQAAVSVAEAVNDLLNPNTYDWGRTIYAGDLAGVSKTDAIDRVHDINGVLAVGMNYSPAASGWTSVKNTNGAVVAAGDYAAMVAGSTIVVDQTGTVPDTYLVVAKLGSNTVQFDRAYEGAGGTSTSWGYFTSGDTTLTDWKTLPYASLSIDPDAPAATIFVLGYV